MEYVHDADSKIIGRKTKNCLYCCNNRALWRSDGSWRWNRWRRGKQMYLDINTPLVKWVDDIRTFKPNIIIGYPSAIKILGELVESGKIEINIIRVISCGEPLGSGLRRFLERTFHAEVINFYGASESLAIGVETGKEGEMILFDDMNIIEVENGTMYLTSLYNFTQPLICYRISDRLVLKKPLQESPFSRAEILPDSVTGKKPLILADCSANIKEAAI